MKKRKPAILVLVLVLVVLIIGSVAVFFLLNGKDNGTSYENTFGANTDVEVFKKVPILKASGTKLGSVIDCGGGNYVFDVNGTDIEDYKAYLKTLEEAGFGKHSDNGEEGMDGYVYTASYTKDNVTVTVSYLANCDKIYVAACEDLPLSNYLIYDESYVAGASGNTKVHMLELNDDGNSFIIQLKNGHFIIEDGGRAADAPYLLDYLESLVPEGNIPVVEAWFITHGHIDHYGALRAIASEEKDAARVYVEGIYFTEISSYFKNIFDDDDLNKAGDYIRTAAEALKTQDGKAPAVYRPQIGQRYYFCDITIEVPLTQDVFTVDSFDGSDADDTSLWLTHRIDNQKFIVGGDAGVSSTNMMMILYDKEYFDVEVMSVLKHGENVYNYFTDYCTVDTYLYPYYKVGSSKNVEENEYLQSTALENLSHGGGGVILTFPYTVGASEKMQICDWRYSDGVPIREIDITADTSWYSEAENTYTLYDVGDLYGFAELVNGGNTFTGKTIELAANIQINKGNAANWSETAPTNVWNPIGTSTTICFQGTFDGKGFSIMGMYINASTGKGTGLFGYTKNATITNLKLTNGYITKTGSDTNGAGSLVGRGSGTISNIYSDVIIDSQVAHVGGIIGRIHSGTADTTITNCWFAGEVNLKGAKTNYGGGIVGTLVSYNLIMTDCLNTGKVKSGAMEEPILVGGLIGAIVNKNLVATLTNCVNTGTIDATVSEKAYVGAVYGGSENTNVTVNVTNVYTTAESCTVTTGAADQIKGTISILTDVNAAATALGQKWATVDGALCLESFK